MIKILLNGQEFVFSVTFSQIQRLRYSHQKQYIEFFEYYRIKNKNISDMAALIYIAYLCANLDKADILSEINFYSLLEDCFSEIEELYDRIYYSKINFGFAKAFVDKTRKYDKKIKMPSFELQDLEDYYCYFVLINKLPEGTFWNCQIPFVEAITTNKNAVEGFINYKEHMLLKK